MIIFMSDILVFTNRSLCQEDFLSRIEKIADVHPKGIVLREKDLSENEYETLAEKVIGICNKYGTQCILHNFADTAKRINAGALHLPLPALAALSEEERKSFHVLGASCHSVKDAVYAEKLGCTYITAGHIFETDCKAGVPGRGLDFLNSICKSVKIPVYAIGGINAENISLIRNCGAYGACVMSGAMISDDVGKYLGELK